MLRSAGHALRLQWRAAPAASSSLVLFTVAVAVSSPAVAWLTRLLVDELASGHARVKQVVVLAVGLIAAGALATASMYVTGYLALIARQRLTVAVEQHLFDRVARFSGLGYLEDPAFRDRLELAEEAAQQAPQAITTFVQEGLRAGITIAAFLVAMLAIWPPIAALLIAAAVPAVIAQVVQAGRRAAVAEVVATTYRRRYFYRSLLTNLSAAKEIRLFGIGELLHGRMVSALSEATGAELQVERRATIVQAALAVLEAFVVGIGVMVVVVGAAQGRFSVGDVTFFLAAVGALQSTVAGVVTQAGQFGKDIYLFAHYEQITGAEDDLGAGTISPAALSTGIEFSDVWFRYDEQGPWILQGVDLFIPSGSTVGLVGLNGAGKSTLVKLLCRFYDPQRGTVRWDGADLRDLVIADLRRRIGVTFQDFMSYELTVAENIGLGDIERMREEPPIRRAAEVAGIDDAIDGLPKGYETLLSRTFLDPLDRSRGVTLSGGLWQRIALARSLMRADADLLILDEPSSGLDAQAEHRMHATIAGHGAGRTRLLISHRLAALRDADLIVVLSGGRIIEKGTHDELMISNGEYARLFSLQAQGYQDQRVVIPESA